MKIKKGFTLIELLVVVLIIALLSSVAVSQYLRSVNRARIAEVNIGLKSMAEALNMHFTGYGVYHDGTLDGVMDQLAVSTPKSAIFNFGVSFMRHSYTYQIAAYAHRPAAARGKGKVITIAYVLDNGKIIEKRCYGGDATRHPNVTPFCKGLGFNCVSEGRLVIQALGYGGGTDYCVFD